MPIDVLEKDHGILRKQIRPLRENIVGKNIMAGVSSPNGHFAVVVERGKKKETMKLVTLSGAHGGGLTCTNNSLSWEVKLRHAGSGDTSAISISIEEQEGALEVIAVDGRGHVVFERISVPGMPARERPPEPRRPSDYELQNTFVPIRELSSEESSRGSFATFENSSERTQIVAD